ncbi:MAG TPA: preprotein translocase subunit YajC [Gaiellaceae bacterium]
MGLLILILVVFAAIWFMFLLPARRRRSAHVAMQDSLDLGDEIITAGGLHGFVRELDDDRLRVEIAPQVVVTLDRRAVAAVAREVEVEVEQEEDEAEDDEPAERR